MFSHPFLSCRKLFTAISRISQPIWGRTPLNWHFQCGMTCNFSYSIFTLLFSISFDLTLTSLSLTIFNRMESLTFNLLKFLFLWIGSHLTTKTQLDIPLQSFYNSTLQSNRLATLDVLWLLDLLAFCFQCPRLIIWKTAYIQLIKVPSIIKFTPMFTSNYLNLFDL